MRIVGVSRTPFRCGNGIPVTPDLSVADDPIADLVILPEVWLRPDETIKGRYPELMDWLRRSYRRGAQLYSACSGSIKAMATHTNAMTKLSDSVRTMTPPAAAGSVVR